MLGWVLDFRLLVFLQITLLFPHLLPLRHLSALSHDPLLLAKSELLILMSGLMQLLYASLIHIIQVELLVIFIELILLVNVMVGGVFLKLFDDKLSVLILASTGDGVAL